MDAIVYFGAAYAGALLAAAAGLHRLGRIDTSPWRSRVLAGHRRAMNAGENPGPVGAVSARPRHPADWLHTEVPRLYTGIGTVAASAATVLPAGVLIGQTRDVLVLGLITAIAGWMLVRLIATLRN